MFKFLKGKQKPSKDGGVPVEEAIVAGEQDETASKTEDLETTLSIPEDWNLTDEEQYVYAFHNSQSPKLKVNQISIYGMELIENIDETIRITGLIRSTVTQTINFENTTIL